MTAQTMQIVIDIVDTIINEMRPLYQADDDSSSLLMLRVHELSWGDGSSPRVVGLQYAKDKVATTTSLRKLGAGGFHIAIDDLASLATGQAAKADPPPTRLSVQCLGRHNGHRLHPPCLPTSQFLSMDTAN